MITVLVYEDDEVDRLWPISMGRPAFAITCGAWRLIDLLRRWQVPLAAEVRPYLRSYVNAEFPDCAAAVAADAPTLLVNARLVASRSTAALLRQLSSSAEPGGILDGQQVVAAWLPVGCRPRDREIGVSLTEWVRQLVPTRQVTERAGDWLLRYPHDVIRLHPTLLADGLEERSATGDLRQLEDGVFVGEGVEITRPVVTDTRHGAIILESGVEVAPFSVLRGPLRLGSQSRVNAHAEVKDHTVLGPCVRIGGEVQASIIESYSNKQHGGYLGHAYVGSWVNLGAGTNNSNLKNTYGTIRVSYGSDLMETGLQLLGCVIGDYTKTAIQVTIFTAKLIGCGSMVYGSVAEHVPDFVNYARSLGSVTAVDVATLQATQARMFSRRGVEQQEYHRSLLADMHAATVERRQGLTTGPVQLVPDS